MNQEDFQRAVNEAIEELPKDLRRQIANVAFVVEEWPDANTLEMADAESPDELLGFYHGIPLTERTSNYGMVLPDKISIYRQPILRECREDAEVRKQIRRTVRHEIVQYLHWRRRIATQSAYAIDLFQGFCTCVESPRTYGFPVF